MFQQMLSATNESTVQRLYRTQIQSVNSNQANENSTNVRNVQENHQDSTGMIFREKPLSGQAKQASKMRRQPIQNDIKKGRNDKIDLVSPSGKEIQVKYKKLNNYLNQGYKQI